MTLLPVNPCKEASVGQVAKQSRLVASPRMCGIVDGKVQRLLGGLVLSFAAIFQVPAADDTKSVSERLGAYYGNYSLAPDHMIGIDRFTSDAGASVMLFTTRQSLPHRCNACSRSPGPATPVGRKKRDL
jgi:hypothetical protein